MPRQAKGKAVDPEVRLQRMPKVSNVRRVDRLIRCRKNGEHGTMVHYTCCITCRQGCERRER